MVKKITILATDFKPMLGGVAEYTFQLADKLNEKGILDQVLTSNIQNESYFFKVSAPQEFSWMKPFKEKSLVKRKFYSLAYICQIKWMELRQVWDWLCHSQKTFVIINWIVSPVSKRWISVLHFLHLQYAIILHGKDIIVTCQNDTCWFADISSRAKLLIFNSQATATLFKTLQPCIKTPYYILYPGVDVNYLRQVILYSVEDLEQIFNCNFRGKLVISSVCRLVKRKGIDLVIRSLEPIMKRNKNIIYIIMGNGEEYQSLKDLIYSLKLDDQILLVGEFKDREKFSILNCSSIFIMPNNYQNGNDFEGFGISFLEASYFKNVVIGGRNGGVTEAIKDGHSGFLVDTDSEYAVESIREVISNLLENPTLMNQMSEFGHKYVVDNFQSTNTVDSFSQYIQDYLLL
ncbi:glycosyltransferase family 4 protein [Nostoc sp.]|uniref:glycosyltransferase family 4 protein n=1 Tax=Nostoc sp. TaxID=1180 RepID=UPI002FFCCBB1